jgi:superfamily I DNA/RNA helicase
MVVILRKITKILGKPGTGKTTFLASKIIEKIDSGLSFDDILFTTYSRSASRAMYEKLSSEKGVKKKELLNFGTIYRLANRTLDLKKENYVKMEHYLRFSNDNGIDFDPSGMHVKKIEDLDEFGTTGDHVVYVEGNILFTWWQILKCIYSYNDNVKKAIRQYIFLNEKQQSAIIHSIDHVIDFYEKWEDYKRELEIYEYQDLLQELIVARKPYFTPFKFAFIDETHDFGHLQMSVLNMWCNDDSVERVYICHDPLQCIYKFTGSDPSIVGSLVADEDILLKKSYRVPEIPWGLSTRMAKSINDHSMEGISPADKQGDVIYVDSLRNRIIKDSLYTDEKTFFLLRRNRDISELLKILEIKRIPVGGIGRTKTIWQGKRFRDVYNLVVRLEKDLPLNKEEVRSLIKVVPVKGNLKRGVKTDFDKRKYKIWGKENKDYKLIEDSTSLFYGLFEGNIGSPYDIKDIISHPTVNLNVKMKEYIEKITDNDILAEKANRWVGTFHASKGLEANNVVLFDFYLREGWDVVDETRLAYVGVTRTRDKIFLKGINEEGFIEQFI